MDSYLQGADIGNEYRQGFSNMLTELYQSYRTELQEIYKFFKEEAENGFIWKES